MTLVSIGFVTRAFSQVSILHVDLPYVRISTEHIQSFLSRYQKYLIVYVGKNEYV